MKKYEFLTRASYTVELALLMPVLIGTILAVIYLDDHVHNCATLTANACEAAVTGHDDAEIPCRSPLLLLPREGEESFPEEDPAEAQPPDCHERSGKK